MIGCPLGYLVSELTTLSHLSVMRLSWLVRWKDEVGIVIKFGP